MGDQSTQKREAAAGDSAPPSSSAAPQTSSPNPDGTRTAPEQASNWKIIATALVSSLLLGGPLNSVLPFGLGGAIALLGGALLGAQIQKKTSPAASETPSTENQADPKKSSHSLSTDIEKIKQVGPQKEALTGKLPITDASPATSVSPAATGGSNTSLSGATATVKR